MQTFAALVALSLNAILIENFIFSKFLGICPFLGVSKKTNTAVGMGFAVIFTMTLASALTYVALLNITNEYNFLFSVVYGFTAGVGFLLAIVLLSLVRERIEYCDIPEPFRGFPIALIASGLLSIAFMGFSGFTLPF